MLTRAIGGRPCRPQPAQDHDFMFSRSVEDPDGSVWEVMWMDARDTLEIHESA